MKSIAAHWYKDTQNTNQNKVLRVEVNNEIKQNNYFDFEWQIPALEYKNQVPPCMIVLLHLKHSPAPALSGWCGNAFCYHPPAELNCWAQPIHWQKKEKNIRKEQKVWKVLRDVHLYRCPGTHAVLSLDKHLGVNGHIIFRSAVFIKLLVKLKIIIYASVIKNMSKYMNLTLKKLLLL